jgi:hypothetical protein
MARTFAATTDQLRFPVINQLTGAYSLGAWVRRNSDSDYDTIYSRCESGGGPRIALQLVATTGKIALEEVGVGEQETSTLTVKEADGWCFVGVHKPAAEAARAHVWKRASGWTHQNLGGTIGNAITVGAGGTVRIGEWKGGTNDNFNGDIEMVVEYNVLLSNEGFESIAFSRSGMLSRRPSGLWELRQASVEQKVLDLSGTGMNESVRAGTSVTSRSCPFYFTGGPPIYSVAPASGPKTYALGIAAETDAALPPTRVKVLGVGQAAETDAAFAATRSKIRALGQPAETDAALAMGRAKARPLGQAAETDAALAMGRMKSRSLGQAAETDAPLAAGRLKTRALGLPAESDAGLALGRFKARALGQAAEVDAALPATRVKMRVLGQAAELDAVFALGRSKTRALGVAAEVDLAQVISAKKARALGLASELDQAFSVVRSKARGLGLASELDEPLVLVRLKIRPLGIPGELDEAITLKMPTPRYEPLLDAICLSDDPTSAVVVSSTIRGAICLGADSTGAVVLAVPVREALALVASNSVISLGAEETGAVGLPQEPRGAQAL